MSFLYYYTDLRGGGAVVNWKYKIYNFIAQERCTIDFIYFRRTEVGILIEFLTAAFKSETNFNKFATQLRYNQKSEMSNTKNRRVSESYQQYGYGVKNCKNDVEPNSFGE